MSEEIWRNEIKYVCSEDELIRIEHSIRNICRLDSHAGEDGKYCVRSLYFDDYQNTCFRENENGVAPRKKYRIRVYDGDKDHIFLECKHKLRDMTRKDSCRISETECESLMRGSFWTIDSRREPLLELFCAEMALRRFAPRLIVQYERTAYTYPVGNVRITFDRNVSMSGRRQDFLETYVPVCPVMPANSHILEVKYNGLIPDFIYNVMQVSDLQQTHFSKFYISGNMQYMGR